MNDLEDDPFLHLEWSEINFTEFLNHLTTLLVDTEWKFNTTYPTNVTLGQGKL